MPKSALPLRALLRRPATGVAAVVAVAVVAGSTSSPSVVGVSDSELPVAPGDRVLQSVNVAMASDGTLTAVEGTTVTAASDGTETDSVTQAYSPDDVVSDLPVRVLTSYRTADGAGTDLSDLEGYDGQVRIDLTVQNLTVKAEELTYDVAGASRTQPALVGAPLTVVAAADLGETKPSAVVTQGAGEDEVTNGALSQGDSGATQVQWATILAPPQLRSSATLSLVVDAQDFETPDFDLSVQPGLVTDPSVGALVQRAFNPAASDEMALQARTIEVVGDVTEVLGEASNSISEVRSSLNTSSETLGEKTVGDLETSVVQIASSMRSLDGTVTGLGDGISSALESTGSSSLAQLQTTVQQLDGLLGDTSGKPATAATNGQGCATTVRTSSGGDSVYNSLLRVAGTLKGYASASDECKDQLNATLLASIGPADVKQCADASAGSVTCSLARTRTNLPKKIETTLDTSESTVLGTLGSTGIKDALDTVTALESKLVNTVGLLRTLGDLAPDGQAVKLKDVADTLAAVKATKAAIEDAVRGAGQDAEAQIKALEGLQARHLATFQAACALLGEPTSLTRDQVKTVTVNVTAAECPADGTVPASIPVDDYSRLAKAAWTRVGNVTNPARDDFVLKSALTTFDQKILAAETALDAAQAKVGREKSEEESELRETLRALIANVEGLEDERVLVEKAVTALDTKQTAAREAIEGAFDGARTDTKADIETETTTSIKDVSKRSAEARQDVTEAFNSSRAGMEAAADDIAADGRATINQQRDDLTKSAREAEKATTASVRAGLGVIADTVSASTRDTDAAGKLLAADLTKVLLDLGDPEVDGSGLLGTLGANAGEAGAADFQLALATRTASSYANARGQDVGGLLLRQEQAEAAFQRQAQLPAFQVDVPDGVERRTVYLFHLGSGE